MIDTRKVAVIGCGFVGSACAFTLMQHGLFSEMVLIDLDKALSSRELRKISANPKIKIDCSTRSIEFKGGKVTRKFGERKIKRIR